MGAGARSLSSCHLQALSAVPCKQGSKPQLGCRQCLYIKTKTLVCALGRHGQDRGSKTAYRATFCIWLPTTGRLLPTYGKAALEERPEPWAVFAGQEVQRTLHAESKIGRASCRE